MTDTITDTNRIADSLAQECAYADGLLKDDNIPELDFFLKEAAAYYDPERVASNPPKLVIAGSVLPASFLPVRPGRGILWIPGGSRSCTDISDELVPRDTDPISRSILGQIMLLEDSLKQCTVLVPLYNDSQKKVLTILIDRGFRCITLDFMSDKGSERGLRAFENELIKLQKILAINMRNISYKKDAAGSGELMQRIAREIERVELAAYKCPGHFSGAQRLFVKNSFYMTADIEGWLEHLILLRSRLESMEESEERKRPRVLIAGSSVFYPNYKVPEILERAGIELGGVVDAVYGMYRPAAGLKEWTENDCSAAYIRNDALCKAVLREVSEHDCDGIVWQVLKGQIEYDYELSRFEKMTEDSPVPVIRLETDYQYQDVEQLRIRLEAFGEMLKTRRELADKQI